MHDDTNIVRKPSEYRGRNVVLYFYPADDTPGIKGSLLLCDDYSAYEMLGIVILGVSPIRSNRMKFKKKIYAPIPVIN
ncbi:MAG: redoxin domain-containing protein [Anaerolineae bacterium]|nr:redoxin domain-containing protein [Anaerolineae bacterium]